MFTPSACAAGILLWWMLIEYRKDEVITFFVLFVILLLLAWSKRTRWSLRNIHFQNGSGSFPVYVDCFFPLWSDLAIWALQQVSYKKKPWTAYPSRSIGFTPGFLVRCVLPIFLIFRVVCFDICRFHIFDRI
jgi:hypothetical protein